MRHLSKQSLPGGRTLFSPTIANDTIKWYIEDTSINHTQCLQHTTKWMKISKHEIVAY